MFSRISWRDYIFFLGSVMAIYYSVVLLLYYSKEIGVLLNLEKPALAIPQKRKDRLP